MVKATSANLGFENKLWQAADKLRSNMDPAEYKHVVLGLIFLKYISDSFEETYQSIKNDSDAYKGECEDRDAYKARNVFWVPEKARWGYLKNNAKKPEIGRIVDEAMIAIEKDNPSLKGVLPKDYARPALNKQRLGEVIDLFSSLGLGDKEAKSKDILGRVYEYFIGRFASAEGKGGGEFYTPSCVVKLLVEMIEPYKGRVYDPCCGSGGMFVQSERFVKEHGGKTGDISIYGQESNNTTWKLCKMNLAIRGIEANIKYGNSFTNDQLPDLKADFVLANPPFNDSDWGGEGLKDGVWITSFNLILPLAFLLRKNLLEVTREKVTAKYKDKKADVLYQYITGHEFRQQVEAIVEVYQEMQQQITKEKAAYEKIWKARQGQVERLLKSTAGVVGSIQGKLGQTALQVKGLELLESGEK